MVPASAAGDDDLFGLDSAESVGTGGTTTTGAVLLGAGARASGAGTGVAPLGVPGASGLAASWARARLTENINDNSSKYGFLCIPINKLD